MEPSLPFSASHPSELSSHSPEVIEHAHGAADRTVDALIQRASQQLHAAAAAAVIEQRDAAIAAVRFLGDAKSSLGDTKSSLGGAKSSLGGAESSLGDANSFGLREASEGHT